MKIFKAKKIDHLQANLQGLDIGFAFCMFLADFVLVISFISFWKNANFFFLYCNLQH
ncbi:MAG: hypothetical protein HUJ51_06750 [Eggerthellaceae bacterium]|nr:hypothetical protein [Eggerthellaceae bacterium]